MEAMDAAAVAAALAQEQAQQAEAPREMTLGGGGGGTPQFQQNYGAASYDAPDSLANLPTPSNAPTAVQNGSSSKKKAAAAASSAAKKKRTPPSASKDGGGKSPTKKSKTAAAASGGGSSSSSAAAGAGAVVVDEEEAKRQERLAKRRERDRKLRERKRREAAEAEEAAKAAAMVAAAEAAMAAAAASASAGDGAAANSDDEDDDDDEDGEDGGGGKKPSASPSAASPGTTHQTPAGSRVTTTTAPAPEIGAGWTVRTAERTDSKNKVRRDKTWINPSGRQFKSIRECTVYKNGLAESGGDEEEAWGLIREERRIKKKASRKSKDGGDGDDGDSSPAKKKATPSKKSKAKSKAKPKSTSKPKSKAKGTPKKAKEEGDAGNNDGSESEPSTPAASAKSPTAASSSAKKKTPGSSSKSGKPKYVDMIHDAIKALKDRSGSSVPAIQKYLLSQYEHMQDLKPKQIKHAINTGIKAGLKTTRFVKVKASYKINAEWVKKERAAQRAKETEKRARERKRQKELEKKRKVQKEKDEAEKAERDRIRKIEQEKERKARKEEEERIKVAAMTPEELVAWEKKKAAELERQRKKEEEKRRAKEIAERIKKRRFPMDDLVLIAEDKEFGVKPPEDVTRRPHLPYAMAAVVPFDARSGGRTPSAIVSASSCSSIADGSRGLISDMMQVYQFFHGDVGYGRINSDIVPDFTLGNLLFAADEIIKGNAKAARAVPPLISHLFVSALRTLTGVDEGRRGLIGDDVAGDDLTAQQLRLRDDLVKIGVGLNVASWAEICMYYMDAMERYFTTDASLDDNALPGLPIDAKFFEDDEGIDAGGGTAADVTMEESEGAALPEGYPGYLGHSYAALFRAFSKLAKHDPWMLTAEELFALLRALTDDILANDPDLAKDILDRGEELYELRKAKRAADINYKRVKLAFEGPKQPAKSSSNNKKGGEKDKDKSGEGKESKADDGAETEVNTQKETEKKAEGKAEEKDESASTEANTKEETETEKAKPETAKKADKPAKPLPKATKREFVAAEKAMIKANEAYDKGLRKLTRRTEPIGCDKQCNPVYFFHHDPERLYIEVSKPAPTSNIPDPSLQYPTKSWHVIDSKSLFDDFLSSLDIRGIRENDLYDAITGGTASVRRYLYDDIKKRNEILARKKELEDLQRRLQNAQVACAAEEEGRRSGRLASLAQVELTKVQEEIELASAALKGKSEPVEIDYRDLTGMTSLAEFDAKMKKRIKASSDHSEEPSPLELCSRLWNAGKGGGALGLVVDEILELEARCEALAPWERKDMPRAAWISGLKDCVVSWKRGNNMLLGPTNAEEGQTSTGPSNPSVIQLLNELKEPLLELESRVFVMTGQSMAVEAADEASQYVADTQDDEDEDRESMARKQEVAELAWKRKIDSLKTIPTKRAGSIRDILIAAIAIARKAHLNETLAELRSALQLHRPGAAGAAKAAALKVLENHGGYEKPEGEEDDDDAAEESELATELELAVDGKAQETKVESLLCGEAMMLSGSLGGDDDADRVDWTDAVKSCKTMSRFAALVQSFAEKADGQLDKIETDQATLSEALKYWGGERKSRTKKEKVFTEIWTNCRLTQQFVITKIKGYPWWPARLCEAKDPSMAKSLSLLNRALISSVGEPHIQVVQKDDIRPYTGENIDEDLSNYDEDIVKNWKESCEMTRRICKKRGLIQATPMKKKKSSSQFMEEKKSGLDE